MNERILIEKIKNKHHNIYKEDPLVIAFAPGRIEVLGNHTDYNKGMTLSAAINQGIFFAISSSNTKSIQINSINLNESVSFSLSKIKSSSIYPWVDYIKGILYYFENEGIKLEGMNCTFYGSIPMGSGLSSSAALEISLLFALQEYYKSSIKLVKLAKIAQLAEQNFAGCQCGLLDQYSSIFGIKNGLIHIDFKTNKITQIPIPNDANFLMVNSNAKHELINSPYNSRRISCNNAVNELNNLLPKKIKSLADISYLDFKKYSKYLTIDSFKRGSHIIDEIERVKKSISLLDNNKLDNFGKLLYESHKSSQINFENSCNELDLIVDIANQYNAKGARLSGGGWGGSVVVLTNLEDAETLLEKIILKGQNKGLKPTGNIIYPSDGAKIIKDF